MLLSIMTATHIRWWWWWWWLWRWWWGWWWWWWHLRGDPGTDSPPSCLWTLRDMLRLSSRDGAFKQYMTHHVHWILALWTPRRKDSLTQSGCRCSDYSLLVLWNTSTEFCSRDPPAPGQPHAVINNSTTTQQLNNNKQQSTAINNNTQKQTTTNNNNQQ